jgi:hypothetical protein
MQVEVTTKLKPGILVLDIALVPRGSGNRNAARRLANEFRENEHLSPHVVKVTHGTSRVLVHLRSSVELMRIVAEWPRPEPDVPGQLPLFGVQLAS